MKTSTRNILIACGAVVLLLIVARYTVFKEQVDAYGAGLQRVGEWEDGYKAQHPGATKEETSAAFRINMTALKEWQAKYKQDHPGATDEEMNAAFNAQFSNK